MPRHNDTRPMKAAGTQATVSGMLTTGVGATLHFLVDGLCACSLFLLGDRFGWHLLLGVFVTYNVLAFLTQPLTGMLADRMVVHHGLLLALSVVLLTWGVAAVSFCLPLAAAVLLGLGNSLFHVWGGKQVAVATHNDVRAMGVFVSTGAFGLAVGMFAHSATLLYVLLGALVIAVGCWLLSAGGNTSAFGRNQASDHHASALSAIFSWGSVLLLMGAVMLRSWLGEQYSTGMAAGGASLLAIGAVAMAGKAFGGWIARWIGVVWTLVLVAAVLLIFHYASFIVHFPSFLFLVNLTMAVTLYLANVVMPGREGLAFGLLAAALMPGYLLGVEHWTMGDGVLPSLLATLLPTIVIELSVLWVLRERRTDVLCSAVVVNVLTNVPLNLFVTYVSHSLAVVVVAELTVVFVEALWYYYFVAHWRQALTYSFLCNGFSLLLGLLASQVYLLVHSS